MDFPHVLIFDDGDSEAEASHALAGYVAELGIENPLVIASRHGKKLVDRLPGVVVETTAPRADQSFAAELGVRAKSAGTDAIIAVGGGRCLDVGKLAAARAGLQVVTAPTQLSHDGICSPVAVVPDDAGRTESLGAITPAAAFVSLPTIAVSPADSARAGIGDLLANPFALRDWALAADRGLEPIDDRAWDLSTQSYDLIAQHLEHGTIDTPEFLRALADALVMSGTAMIVAGTSRPASGAEHQISHAIDHELGGRALHGAQVSFGCIFSAALYGEDVAAFRAQLRRIGLPDHPRELGLDEDGVVALLLAAPHTRPGRFTILEETNLDEGSARALVRRIWD